MPPDWQLCGAVLRRGGQLGGQLGKQLWFPKMIALSDVAAEAGEQGHGFRIFDPFGDRDGTEAMGQIDRRFNHFEVPLRIAHRHHESFVDLDLVGLDLGQIFEVRLAGAIIVDRQADAGAAELGERLAGLAPEHRIALEARRALANYDANDTEALGLVDALLRLFPDDIPLRLHKAGLLSTLRPHAEHLAYLQEQAGRLFDPACVEALMREETRLREICAATAAPARTPWLQ